MDKAREVMGLTTAKPVSNINRKTSNATSIDVSTEKEKTVISSPSSLETLQKFNSNGPVAEEDDRVKEYARDIFNCTEVFIPYTEASSWLMKTDDFNSKVRSAYMDLFDFVGIDILAAVRKLCGKLYLKGETQQIDRILDALGKRWYECNPENGLKDPGISR
jgi:Sec7-like guanine-nucleotide exchange factor